VPEKSFFAVAFDLIPGVGDLASSMSSDATARGPFPRRRPYDLATPEYRAGTGWFELGVVCLYLADCF